MVSVSGGVDLTQVGGDLLLVLVGHESERRADGVHDAGLYPGVGEDGLDRFGVALEPVDAADEHVLDAAGLQVGQDSEPELAPSVF